MEPDPTEDILGPKKRNYDFLQLVRDKNYPEALMLGKIILRDSPDNPSVQKFVDFIQKNAKKLDDMVKEEEEYQSVHSGDSESEEEVQGEDVKSSSSSDSKEDKEEQMEQEQEKPQKKVELTTCTLNAIPHVCPRHHKLLIEAAKNGKI